jgi:hypothetical protein
MADYIYYGAIGFGAFGFIFVLYLIFVRRCECGGRMKKKGIDKTRKVYQCRKCNGIKIGKLNFQR